MSSDKKGLSISRPAMQKYLSKREGKPVRVTEYVKLGSGWHGSGYKISYIAGKHKRSVVLRTINPVGFSHDHPSDRASVFIMQNELFNSIPGHVRSIDVGAAGLNGELISLGSASEFFQIVEVASGSPYVKDLDRIAGEGKLRKEDLAKARLLSDYLVKLHKKKFNGPKERERSIRLRHLRDAVGSGEMLMGVLDTYPPRSSWINDEAVADVISLAVKFNRRIKELRIPLVRLHGDFHPGNIWFKGNKLTLLDASREPWGIAADDLTALSINYIWYALKTTGGFKGPFKELFEVFWGNYLSKTKDKFANASAPLFFAFRAAVVAHPLFYPAQSNAVRRKIFAFIKSILSAKVFDPGKINSYLRLK